VMQALAELWLREALHIPCTHKLWTSKIEQDN
jgi:hypothetical protein